MEGWQSRLQQIKGQLLVVEASEPIAQAAELLLEAADALVEWDLVYGARNVRAQAARRRAGEVAARLRRLERRT